MGQLVIGLKLQGKTQFPRYWTDWVKQGIWPRDCLDAGEAAAFTLMRLQRLPVLLPTFCPSKAQPALGHRGLSPVLRSKSRLSYVLWALQKLCRTERTWLWKGSSESLSSNKLLDIQYCWEEERVRLDFLEPVALTSPDVLKHVNLSLPE